MNYVKLYTYVTVKCVFSRVYSCYCVFYYQNCLVKLLVSSESLGELNIFWHDSDSLGVNSAKIGTFKQAN